MTTIAKLITAVLLATAPGPAAQAQGIPYDWSHHHLIFSKPATLRQEKALELNPRYWMQKLWRQRQSTMSSSIAQMQSLDALAVQLAHSGPLKKHKTRLKRDWSMNMGNGATVGAGVFPAKFSFSTAAANCDNATTPDFVVFNTGLSGSNSQPTIVAYDNLYSGCTSPNTVPLIYWQYNTAYPQGSMTGDASSITTSVVLSGDGSQIAFVQSASSVASLVILKWAKNSSLVQMDTAGNNVMPPSYRSCAAPCMTRMVFNGSPNDTNSAPFYDYANDVLYVGDNAGKLHKFIHIFVSGTPQEITGGGLSSGWPQQIDPSTTALLTSPVYDFSSGNVFVGSSGGKLYHIPGGGASTGGGSQNIVGSATLATTSNSTGITAPPLVDSTAGRVYVFVQTDNSSSCNNGSAHQCFSATYQLTNTFSGSSAGTERTLGGSSVSGGSPDVIAFAGSFDNNYFNSGNATGSLYVCGPDTGGTIPTLYQLPLTTNSLGAATTGPALAAGATNCSPVTEFFDGTNDWAFLSVQADNKTAAPVTCPSGMGCIMSFNVTSASGFGSSKSTSSTALEAGGTSGIVIDNNVTTPSGSQVYFSPLANQSCAGNGSTGSGTGGCATQASQSGL